MHAVIILEVIFLYNFNGIRMSRLEHHERTQLFITKSFVKKLFKGRN